MPKTYFLPNFVKIVRAVLKIYEIYVDVQINRQITQFFYQVETYLEGLLMPEIYVISNFGSGPRNLRELCSGTDRQTTRFFYKIETYLDDLLMPKIYLIQNFVKIVRAVLEI